MMNKYMKIEKKYKNQKASLDSPNRTVESMT